MSEESRVKRWRQNKHQQGLKAMTIWVTEEEELRAKDLAIQWRCSASEVLRRGLAQISTSAPDTSSPTDTLPIRKLILAELEALGFTAPTVPSTPTVSESVGPTDTLPETSIKSPVPKLTRGSTPKSESRGPDTAPAYDTSKFMLGPLCEKRHDFDGKGHSLRQKGGKHECRTCKNGRSQAHKQRKREEKQQGAH